MRQEKWDSWCPGGACFIFCCSLRALTKREEPALLSGTSECHEDASECQRRGFTLRSAFVPVGSGQSLRARAAEPFVPGWRSGGQQPRHGLRQKLGVEERKRTCPVAGCGRRSGDEERLGGAHGVAGRQRQRGWRRREPGAGPGAHLQALHHRGAGRHLRGLFAG